jgi:hypothetical protein
VKGIPILRQSSHRPKPSFAGRNLFVALRDEALPDVIALNRVLEPFLLTLFRLAARGHWIQERRPVRSQRHAHIHTSHIPPAVAEELTLIASCNTEGEIQLELVIESRGVATHFGTIRRYASLSHWSNNWSQDGLGTVCTFKHQPACQRRANPESSVFCG